MALLGRSKSSPRLIPELDDGDLGRLRKQLKPSTMPGMTDFNVEAAERLVKDTGTDWDRRWHRISVLAETTADFGFDRSWMLRRPRSADALLFGAWVAAVRVRRGEPATELPEAVQWCLKAGDARPQDPLPYVALLGLLRLLRSPSDQLNEVWQAVVLRDPWNREAHLQILGYLSAEECGVPGQARDFVDAQQVRMPADAPAAALELTAAVRDYHRSTAGDDLNAILADLWWGRPRSSAVLDRALASWTRPGFLRHAAATADLNLLAYALVQAGRVAEAAPVFRQLGPTVVAWPWSLQGDPVEQFAHWRGRSLR
ncbi:hypothetical protein DN069_03375 [Streptacidiphilus pinicola]|uniref:DUF4034 domain-containing protein n=1 Tax=Streptacidiphilus pinicola TaxID=2219663 RepID=A0A2X0ITR6_9ACTN|nr:hypothetical protein [Streptacidiphilus pinicola]RAG87013.1 hypothetical protein DN069_03375 [Streptacidiphilus pinicola]